QLRRLRGLRGRLRRLRLQEDVRHGRWLRGHVRRHGRLRRQRWRSQHELLFYEFFVIFGGQDRLQGVPDRDGGGQEGDEEHSHRDGQRRADARHRGDGAGRQEEAHGPGQEGGGPRAGAARAGRRLV
ncbi:unnamed protein product, partial [Prorocentrum cordatum]